MVPLGPGFLFSAELSASLFAVLLALIKPAGVRDSPVQGLHSRGCNTTRYHSSQRKREHCNRIFLCLYVRVEHTSTRILRALQ